jgi:hypothetical protein
MYYDLYAVKHHYLSIEGTEQAAVDKAIRSRIIWAQRLYALGASLCFVSTYLSIFVIIAIQLNYAFGILKKS